MESKSRADLGMVRTSKEELESQEERAAWWMHEACMDKSDLRSFFGGEKELALATAAADEADAKTQPSSKATGAGSTVAGKKADATPAVDPMEKAMAAIQNMSVKELKAFLDKHSVSHDTCVEKADLVKKAREVRATLPPEPPPGPAWMQVGDICRLCTKPTAKEHGGVICRRRRADGGIGGCGEAVCWRCMKRAPKDSFGGTRTTKEEFESLGEDAWWMHEGCFEGNDYADYFGEEAEVEEDDKDGASTQAAAVDDGTEAWDDTDGGRRLRAGGAPIMYQCGS